MDFYKIKRFRIIPMVSEDTVLRFEGSVKGIVKKGTTKEQDTSYERKF